MKRLPGCAKSGATTMNRSLGADTTFERVPIDPRLITVKKPFGLSGTYTADRLAFEEVKGPLQGDLMDLANSLGFEVVVTEVLENMSVLVVSDNAIRAAAMMGKEDLRFFGGPMSVIDYGEKQALVFSLKWLESR